MSSSSSEHDNSPTAVLNRFYDAEREYMTAGGAAAGASFDGFAAVMAPDVVLHQNLDLPWGGKYVGIKGFADWAAHMSSLFDTVDITNPEFAEMSDKVVIYSTLVIRTKNTQETLKNPMVQVVTVKDGKITEFRPFYWQVSDYVALAEREKKSSSR